MQLRSIPCLLLGIAAMSSAMMAHPHDVAWADETLDRVLDQAMASNPTIAAARQRWEMTKAEAPQARALDDPVVSITEWDIPSNGNLSETGQTWYGIEQTFPFPGKRGIRGAVARLDAEAAEQDYLAVSRRVRAQVKMTYARLYRVQQQIAVHREHQALLNELIQSALQRYTAGAATQQESLKAQVELSTLHASLLVLEQEQQSLRIELNTLEGRPDDPLFFGTAQVEYRPFTVALNTLETQALEQRPEIRAAGRMVARQDEAISLAQRGWWPDFVAEVSYWDVHDGPNRWMLTGKMTLPWVASGKYRAKIAEETAGRARAEAEVDEARNETVSLVRDAFLKLNTSQSLIDLYRSGIIAQAEQGLESARIAYTTGRTDFLNVIDAERQLRDVRLAADVAVADWAEQRAELERVVGIDLP
ncbi:MAG: TolC family protein [Nitrospirae bacterium]|nr:TolC family protein [Nitrospirota bacterium]